MTPHAYRGHGPMLAECDLDAVMHSIKPDTSRLEERTDARAQSATGCHPLIARRNTHVIQDMLYETTYERRIVDMHVMTHMIRNDE